MIATRLLLVSLLVLESVAARPASSADLTHTSRRRSTTTACASTVLTAARPAAASVTPAAKVLDVCVSTASETALLLLLLQAGTAALERLPAGTKKQVLSQLMWVIIVQGSSRIQGVCQQVGRTKQVLNPQWYDSLEKPSWNPPAWAFPLAWIPLKLMQTFAANFAWQALEGRVFSAPIVLFLAHLALGDVWNVQFFLKQRPLTGVFVISIFWGVLLAATISFYAASPLAGLLLAPTAVWVFVAANLNLDVWYLNRHR